MTLSGTRKLRRRILNAEEGKGFARRIRREKNDGAVAISCCGFVDTCLKAKIFRALPNEDAAWKLFDDRGLLESLGAKIALGHALGLYGNQTRRNLDILRQVRNLFAHSIGQLTFATPEIAHACRELAIPPQRDDFRVADLGSDPSPRERYVYTVVTTGFWIFMSALGAARPHWRAEPGDVEATPLP